MLFRSQLSDARVDSLLAARGITWVPDYLANAGGLIQVAGERAGDDGAVVESRVRAIGGRAAQILDRARAEGTTPGHAADRVAEERIDGA